MIGAGGGDGLENRFDLSIIDRGYYRCQRTLVGMPCCTSNSIVLSRDWADGTRGSMIRFSALSIVGKLIATEHSFRSAGLDEYRYRAL